MLDGYRNGRFALIGRTACHHFIHHNTQRIDVRTAVHTATLGLLRRNIVHRAQRFLGKSVALRHHTGDAEVSHLDCTVFQHHYIVGLDIPVHNATAVGVFQSLCNLDSEVESLLPVQHALLFHILLQGNTFDQFHYDIIHIPGKRSRHVVYCHNIGMAEHGNSLAFAVKTIPELLITQEVVLQNFDGYQPIQSVAAGFINNCHTAGTNDFQDFVSVIQQTAYVFIHTLLLYTLTKMQVTLSGAPRFLAISKSRRQQSSGWPPCTTSKRISWSSKRLVRPSLQRSK